MDCSPPSSSTHGIFQAGILEQVAISSSWSLRGSFLPRDQTHISRVSCIGRFFLYHCSTQEALSHHIQNQVTLKAPCWRGYIERPQRDRERCLRRTGWPVFNYLRLLAQARSSFQMIPFSSLQAAPVHNSKQSRNELSPPSLRLQICEQIRCCWI